MTRMDTVTTSYIISPASLRERVRMGWCELVRKKPSGPTNGNPSGPASIFLLCLQSFKYNERYKRARQK